MLTEPFNAPPRPSLSELPFCASGWKKKESFTVILSAKPLLDAASRLGCRVPSCGHDPLLKDTMPSCQRFTASPFCESSLTPILQLLKMIFSLRYFVLIGSLWRMYVPCPL